MTLTTYHESEYAIFDTRKPSQPAFHWRAGAGGHVTCPPLPEGNKPHDFRTIDTQPTERLALWAIARYAPVLDMLGRLADEPRYRCAKCGQHLPQSAFRYDAKNTRRGFTRSWCMACDRDDRNSRYARNKAGIVEEK